MLVKHSTVAMSELARQVGLSPTPVGRRLQKREQAGVVLRRVVLVDPEQVGVGLIVFVAIEAHEHAPDWLAEFASIVASMPEVMDAYRMAGEVDYMLRIAVAGHGGLRRLLQATGRGRAAQERHVRFAMERLKGPTACPLPASAFRDRRPRRMADLSGGST